MSGVKDCLVIITWHTKVSRVKRGRDYNLIISKAFWSVVSMLNESFMFSTSFPALSLWAAQEVVFDEAIWRSWRGLVWGKLSYSWRIGVRLILLLLYSPPTYLYRYHHHQTSPVLHYTQEHSQWHFCQSLFFFDPKYSIHVNFVESLSNQRRVDAAMYFNNHVWLWALFLIKFDQHTHTLKMSGFQVNDFENFIQFLSIPELERCFCTSWFDEVILSGRSTYHRQ